MRSPPSAAMPRPNSVSASSMRTGSASRPTRRSPPGGTSGPRRRATPTRRSRWRCCATAAAALPSDPARAAALLEQATERGNPRAHYHFALHLLDGKGIAENRVMAETHLRKAALAGYRPAMVALARLHGDGFEAAQWWRAAANAGDPEAQFAVGVMYARGEAGSGTARHRRRWFEKAAEQGHAAAQFNIGICPSERLRDRARSGACGRLVCPRRGAGNGAGADPPRASVFYRRGGAAGLWQGGGMAAAGGGNRRQRGRNAACRSLPERQRRRARSGGSGTAAALRRRPRLRPGLAAAWPSLRRRSRLAGEARGGDPLLSRRGRAEACWRRN